MNEQIANVTEASDDGDVKWRHWFGHRNVVAPPNIPRFRQWDSETWGFRIWAVPSSDGWSLGDGCLMRGGGGSVCIHRVFCGVCTAELVRRLALVSMETFIGRHPDTYITSFPNQPTVSIAQGTTRILDSAFHGNTSLQTIHIPASVSAIGDFAFIGATGLSTIINFSTVPQQINSTTFAGVIRTNIDVLIPPNTTQAYIAVGWTGFNLVEIGISARVSDLLFDGTVFTYDTIELTGSNALHGVELHVEVNKHSGSNVTSEPIRQVDIDQSGVGIYSPVPSSVGSFANGEHIEVLVYADSLKQALLTRQHIQPAVFAFE